jgi:serine protease Do/serine protease DegQ
MIYSVKRGSPAWTAGLRQDDVITSVNKQSINSLDDFKPLVHNNEPLLLNIIRNRQSMFLLLR